MASVASSGTKRAKIITRPMETLRNGVLALKPAKADSLLPAPEEYAYRISEKPCAPVLFRLATVDGNRLAMPAPIRQATGVARHTSTAIFISRASIFLPRYSGVWPTIRPAMNTVRITKPIMPYRPQPTPPNTTSPSSISSIGTRPPRGV